MKSRLAATAAALLLPLAATAGVVASAAPASASVIYGPQCSEVYDGHVIWIRGIRYVCTRTSVGWWYIAYFYGCGTAVQVSAPARIC